MQVKIESRSDYELYVKKQLKQNNISEYMYVLLFKIIMQSFDDGMRLCACSLKVEV